MKMFLFLLCFIALPVQAQRNINSITYQGNVKPILKGIISDFYQMISLFPQFPKELLPVLEQLDDLHTQKEFLKEKCPRFLDKNCITNADELQEQLSRMSNNLLKLIKEIQLSETLHLSSLTGIRATVDIQIKTDELKALLNNSLILIKAQIRHKRLTFEVIKLIDEISTLMSLTLIDHIPILYKEEFRQFYFNFIHPCQQHLGKKMGFEFMNQNIKDLNFSLNLLNQNLTKRNKKTPEGMGPYLLTIHNKWNSLLRFYY